LTGPRAQPLSPDRIEYLEMRARTDCILAWQVGDTLQFFGEDARKVAQLCGMVLSDRGRDAKGNPVPFTEIPAFFSGEGADYKVSIEADHINAIMDAGIPMALAVERRDEDGAVWHENAVTLRPQLGRAVLRVV
jgi:hypothetical protein